MYSADTHPWRPLQVHDSSLGKACTSLTRARPDGEYVTTDLMSDILWKLVVASRIKVKEHSGAGSALRGILKLGGSSAGRRGRVYLPVTP